MKLYNQTEDKVQKLKVIKTPTMNYVVAKLSEAEINALGYYYIEYTSVPDRRYYTYEKSGTLVVDKYVISYASTDKPLIDVQNRMLDDLRDVTESKLTRPLVDTGLGYNVYGGRDDIEELVDAKDNAETEIVDADNNVQSVTGVSYTTIATAIKADRATTRTIAKGKVTEIRAFITLAQCINYENEPYDDNGETKYRNNVTDW